ncbi:hypothetical protein [Limnovirga soli]|uniref:Uncharacterized protein n=1 Tax=Limnovirga soli TaxID=2656915 RepID=A0A8J8F9N8_9BACT|nr:hypothetical protein [Limnovirga soli]NNV54075.1 hypothetical protein [Limnovirga soli]
MSSHQNGTKKSTANTTLLDDGDMVICRLLEDNNIREGFIGASFRAGASREDVEKVLLHFGFLLQQD